MSPGERFARTLIDSFLRAITLVVVWLVLDWTIGHVRDGEHYWGVFLAAGGGASMWPYLRGGYNT